MSALSCVEMVYNKLCGSGKEENNLKLVDPAIRLLAAIHYLPVVITGQLPRWRDMGQTGTLRNSPPPLPPATRHNGNFWT